MRKPSPEARAAATLLAPLPASEMAPILARLEIALGLRPMPEGKLPAVKEVKP
jgi:hypothetical protein